MASKALMAKRQTALDKLSGLLKDGDIDGLRIMERAARRFAGQLTKGRNKSSGIVVGANVTFTPKDGQKREGTVRRLGPQRATVELTNYGGRWAVPYVVLAVLP